MPVALKFIKAICFTLFVAGIPALIVSSIAGNNEGWVLTFGLVTAGAAIVLLAVSATTTHRRLDVFDEVIAERIESRVRALVEAGADETSMRELVRDALDLARGQS